MGSLLAEFKRRNVYRVAAGYTVVAWLLIQIVNNLSPILDLPAWLARVLLLFLTLGFPAVIALGWCFEITPDGVKRTAAAGPGPARAHGAADWALAAALALVIGVEVYAHLVPAIGGRAAQDTATAAPSAVQTAGTSIAVLPFANMSGDAAQEFFSDGMTEEITAALAKVSTLRVVARTSAFQFKGQNQDLRKVGEALGANHLVEGSVRKAGGRVRITVQLVKVQDGTNLWAESYDRELSDIFVVQEDIAMAVTGALRVSLGLEQGERLVSSRTGNLASYENYLRAKALVRSRYGPMGLRRLTEASGLLEQVVARDPGYAPAWALLAYAYALTPVYNRSVCCGSGKEASAIALAVMPKAEAAALRAIALDPASAEGYSGMGFVQLLRGNWAAAADLYARALAIDANNPDALHHFSGALADLGYVKQALPLRQRLQVIEPFVPVFKSDTLRTLFVEGRTPTSLPPPMTCPSALLHFVPEFSLRRAVMARPPTFCSRILKMVLTPRACAKRPRAFFAAYRPRSIPQRRKFRLAH